MRRIAPAFVVLALLVAAGCQPQPERVVEPPATRVENPELGLAIGALPAPFEVAAAEGTTWTFAADGGTLVVSVGPAVDGSINLVEEVKARKAWFEGTEGGSYYGNRELGGPFGTIYTARGAYTGTAGPVEETWAYAIHPGDYRLLSVQYTYPTGQSGTRVEQLMEFLGEIEALPVDES